MGKKIEKIDIRKVLIAPKYKKVNRNFYFTGGGLALRTFYEYTHEWIALYPSNQCNEFYNLSDNFESIIIATDQVSAPNYSVNLKLSKPLTYFLHASKYKYDIKYIKFEDLLYLIEPINRMQEYLYENSKDNYENIQYDSSKLITVPVCIQGKKMENHILEEHEYFLVDINDGTPVSYGFINNEIPYIIRDEIKKYRTENKKSLIKSLFRK